MNVFSLDGLVHTNHFEFEGYETLTMELKSPSLPMEFVIQQLYIYKVSTCMYIGANIGAPLQIV